MCDDNPVSSDSNNLWDIGLEILDEEVWDEFNKGFDEAEEEMKRRKENG